MFETTVLVVLLSVANGLIVRSIWGRRVHTLEAILPVLAAVPICWLCKLGAEAATTTDQEFHAGWCVRADYREGWTEEYTVEVDDYCTRTDAKGRPERYRCGSHRERRTRSHPPAWDLVDSNGYDVAIDAGAFEAACARFGNRTTRPAANPGQVSIGDGRTHRTTWRGEDATLLPVTTRHAYRNKVRAAARSVFHFQPPDADEVAAYGLFPRPEIRDFCRLRPVRGDDSPAADRAAVRLEAANARLGRSKQVAMLILVFRERPIEAALKQEAYWMGGAKNEFITCVGVDAAENIAWAHVISWTDEERLKIDVRDFARAMGRWDPEKLVGDLVPAVERGFVRKSFADFDYLQVETPAWGKALAVVLAALVMVGVDVAAVRNDFGEPEPAADPDAPA